MPRGETAGAIRECFATPVTLQTGLRRTSTSTGLLLDAVTAGEAGEHISDNPRLLVRQFAHSSDGEFDHGLNRIGKSCVSSTHNGEVIVKARLETSAV